MHLAKHQNGTEDSKGGIGNHKLLGLKTNLRNFLSEPPVLLSKISGCVRYMNIALNGTQTDLYSTKEFVHDTAKENLI